MPWSVAAWFVHGRPIYYTVFYLYNVFMLRWRVDGGRTRHGLIIVASLYFRVDFEIPEHCCRFDNGSLKIFDEGRTQIRRAACVHQPVVRLDCLDCLDSAMYLCRLTAEQHARVHATATWQCPQQGAPRHNYRLPSRLAPDSPLPWCKAHSKLAAVEAVAAVQAGQG